MKSEFDQGYKLKITVIHFQNLLWNAPIFHQIVATVFSNKNLSIKAISMTVMKKIENKNISIHFK